MGRAATEEEYKIIRAMLLSRDFSAAQIAAALGRSRGSICGIIHRTPELKEIGLPNSRCDTSAVRRAKKTAKERVTDALKEQQGVKDARHLVYGKRLLRGLKPLIMLASHHCRFPVEGEGADTLFCAEARIMESSYCNFHRSVCVAALRRTG